MNLYSVQSIYQPTECLLLIIDIITSITFFQVYRTIYPLKTRQHKNYQDSYKYINFFKFHKIDRIKVAEIVTKEILSESLKFHFIATNVEK